MIADDPRILLAALAGAVCAATAVGLVLHPPRRLGVRVRPYAQLARSRLGTGYADASVLHVVEGPSGAVREVFGPMLRRVAQLLGRLVDAADRDTVELRLQQAGFADSSPDQYRMRQLAWTVGGVSLGAGIGLLLGASAAIVLVLAVLVGFPAATYWRVRVAKAIEERRTRMRIELYTVSQLLAVYGRTGHGPVDAVRHVVRRGRGPVVGELDECLSWIGAGTPPQVAYERLALRTPEPTCARLYRILSAAAQSGGDLTRSLLAVSNDLRSERRDEVARAAIKRRTAMLLPLLVLIAPVMLLFVAGALPHIVFGR